MKIKKNKDKLTEPKKKIKNCYSKIKITKKTSFKI